MIRELSHVARRLRPDQLHRPGGRSRPSRCVERRRRPRLPTVSLTLTCASRRDEPVDQRPGLVSYFSRRKAGGSRTAPARTRRRNHHCPLKHRCIFRHVPAVLPRCALHGQRVTATVEHRKNPHGRSSCVSQHPIRAGGSPVGHPPGKRPSFQTGPCRPESTRYRSRVRRQVLNTIMRDGRRPRPSRHG